MSQRTDYLVQRLAEQGKKTLALFGRLTPHQWGTVVYSEETDWDARTLLSHFVTSEQSMQKLFQNIQAGGPGTPEDFDLDRFNASRAARMAGASPQELLQYFEETRRATIEWVKALSDDDLDKRGRHATEGVQSLDRLIKVVYKHNQLHELDMCAALGMPNPTTRALWEAPPAPGERAE